MSMYKERSLVNAKLKITFLVLTNDFVLKPLVDPNLLKILIRLKENYEIYSKKNVINDT